MDKKFLIVLIIAIAIRILISSITFHSDIVHFDFAAFNLSQGNLLSFYDYIVVDPQTNQSFPGIVFNYPPGVYILLGTLAYFFSLFFDNTFYHNFLFNTKEVLGTLPLFVHLLLLKLPYIPFDIACAFLLSKLFESKKNQFLAFSLWLFNPINLYATYMVGQFDIISTFFVILTLYLFKKNIYFAAVALGIGGAFKMYPLFFLIPLAVLTPELAKRLKIITLGLIPYLLMIFPYIFSPGFRSTALVANQTTKSFYAQIPVSGGESIILFITVMVFLYILFWQKKLEIEIWQKFLVVLLPFFVFTHFHPQWFLWLTPLLLIHVVESLKKDLIPIGILFASWFGMLFFFEASLTVGLFSPIWPNLMSLSSIWQTVGIQPDINFFRSLLQSIFVGAAGYLVYSNFKTSKSNSV